MLVALQGLPHRMTARLALLHYLILLSSWSLNFVLYFPHLLSALHLLLLRPSLYFLLWLLHCFKVDSKADRFEVNFLHLWLLLLIGQIIQIHHRLLQLTKGINRLNWAALHLYDQVHILPTRNPYVLSIANILCLTVGL